MKGVQASFVSNSEFIIFKKTVTFDLNVQKAISISAPGPSADIFRGKKIRGLNYFESKQGIVGVALRPFSGAAL